MSDGAGHDLASPFLSSYTPLDRPRMAQSEVVADCPLCAESAPLIAWGACGHRSCAACVVRQVRNELDVPSDTRLGCAQCGALVAKATLDAAAAWVPPPERTDDAAYRPLAAAALVRARARLAAPARAAALATAAASGVHGGVLCPSATCSAVHVPDATLPGHRLAACHTCDAKICAACATAWEGHGGGVTCAHVAATRRAADGDTEKSAAANTRVESADAAIDVVVAEAASNIGGLAASIKQCPQCGTPFSHYRAHGCHHGFPGGGCPGCIRLRWPRPAHFCIVCLGPWPCISRDTQNGCNTFCDATCDCADCPDCAPGRPCEHCPGAGGGCRVCSGDVAAEAADPARAAAWAAQRADAVAAKLLTGWRGPKLAGALRPVVHPPSASSRDAGYVGYQQAAAAEADRAGADGLRWDFSDAYQSVRRAEVRLLAAGNPRELTALLHEITVGLTTPGAGTEADNAPEVAVAYGLPNAVVQAFNRVAAGCTSADGDGARDGGVPPHGLCEAVLELTQALATLAPRTSTRAAAERVARMAREGAFDALHAVMVAHPGHSPLAQRALRLLAELGRTCMAAGRDLPPQAEAALDAAGGIPLMLRVVASAAHAGDAQLLTVALRALAGTRLNTPRRADDARQAVPILTALLTGGLPPAAVPPPPSAPSLRHSSRQISVVVVEPATAPPADGGSEPTAADGSGGNGSGCEDDCAPPAAAGGSNGCGASSSSDGCAADPGGCADDASGSGGSGGAAAMPAAASAPPSGDDEPTAPPEEAPGDTAAPQPSVPPEVEYFVGAPQLDGPPPPAALTPAGAAAAIVALARAVEAIGRDWMPDDAGAVAVALRVGPTQSAGASLHPAVAAMSTQLTNTVADARYGYRPPTAADRDTVMPLWEGVVLAGALRSLRARATAVTWRWSKRTAPFPPALAALVAALPPAPSSLQARAAVMRFRPGTLRTHLATDAALQEEIAAVEDAAEVPVWLQVIVAPLALVWLGARAAWWALGTGASLATGYVLLGIESAGRGVVAAAAWVVDGVVVPVITGVYRYVLQPLGRGVSTAVSLLYRGVTTTASLLYRGVVAVVNGVVRGVVAVATALRNATGAVGAALWNYVLAPAGRAVVAVATAFASGVRALVRGIRDYVVVPLWTRVLVPAARGFYRFVIYPPCWAVYWGVHYVLHGVWWGLTHIGRVISWVNRHLFLGISWVLTHIGRGIAWVFNHMGRGVAWVFTQIGRGISAVGTAIWRAAEWVWQRALLPVFKAIGAGIAAVVRGIGAALSFVWRGIAAAATYLWLGVSTAAAFVWGGLTAAAAFVWGGLTAAAAFVWRGVTAVATYLWLGVSTVASFVWAGVSAVASFVWNGVAAVAGFVWRGVSAAATYLWLGVSTVASYVWGSVSAVAGFVWRGVSAVASAVGSAVAAIGRVVYAALAGVASALGAVASAVGGAIMAVVRPIGHAVAAAGKAVGGAVTSTARAVGASVAAVGSAVSRTGRAIGGAVRASLRNVRRAITGRR